MTRPSRDQIQVKAGNDVYTGLAAAACVVLLIGIIVMITGSNAVFGDSLFFPSGNTASASR